MAAQPIIILNITGLIYALGSKFWRGQSAGFILWLPKAADYDPDFLLIHEQICSQTSDEIAQAALDQIRESKKLGRLAWRDVPLPMNLNLLSDLIVSCGLSPISGQAASYKDAVRLFQFYNGEISILY